MKTSCEIIRDLLPLYVEHVTSEASNALVEEHLNECPDCKKELEQMQRPVPVKVEASEVPLKKIRNKILKNRIFVTAVAVLIVICLATVSAKLYTAQTEVTVADAKIWTYNTKENGANLCNLEVQGENVWLMMQEDFSWGKKVISVQAVTFRFPHFHALLEPVVTAFLASDNRSSGSEMKRIAVSNTQILSVECADDILYYQEGQEVYRYVMQNEDGSDRYVYESESDLDGQFSRG